MKFKLFTIPNIITCMNLVSGCISISFAFYGDFKWAFLMIVIAAVFDFFDGFTARLLKSYSEIGKELDSLADMVSFGAAPAVILYNLLEAYTEPCWINYLVFVVAAFSALRLAKFNLDDRQSSEFIGLPTPANAILIGATAYIAAVGNSLPVNLLASNPWYVIIFAVILSLLLTSEIRMFSLKFKNFGLKENLLRYIFMLYTVVLVVVSGLEAIALVILSYIVVSVVRHFALTTGRNDTPAQ